VRQCLFRSTSGPIDSFVAKRPPEGEVVEHMLLAMLGGTLGVVVWKPMR